MGRAAVVGGRALEQNPRRALDGETDVEDATSFTAVVDGETGAAIAEGAPATIEVTAGAHEVTEIVTDGYDLVSIEPSTAVVPVEGYATVTITNRVAPTSGDGEPTDRHVPRRGGHRHPQGSVLGASTEEGSVLGAETDCRLILDGYVWANGQNDPAVVRALQTFLNGTLPDGATKLDASGVYDEPTRAAVLAYQLAHWEEILKPWFDLGLLGGPRQPTGNVYKLTQWFINRTACADLPAPQLP